METSYWSEEVEKLLLPPITIGNHEITVIVNDSSGNSKTEIFPLSIFPKRGVDLEVVSQSLTGDLSEGGSALYVLQMKNNGFDDTMLEFVLRILATDLYTSQVLKWNQVLYLF